MFYIDLISRIVHVSTAILLVGGSAFIWMVLLPASKSISDEAKNKLLESVTGIWKRAVHMGIVLFLASGFYNFFRALEAHRGDSLYHALVGTKILLALFVFFIASALVGKSSKLEFIRRDRSRWLTIMLAVAAAIVAISGYVKVRGPYSETGSDPMEQNAS